MAGRELFEVAKSRAINGWYWECTCGLRGNCYWPKKEDAITDGRGHQCCIDWPANAKRSEYIGEAPSH